jgi:hypothetical protein
MATAHIPLTFAPSTFISIRVAGSSTVVLTAAPQGMMPELISLSAPVIFTDMELGPLQAISIRCQPGFSGVKLIPASLPGARPPALIEAPAPCHSSSPKAVRAQSAGSVSFRFVDSVDAPPTQAVNARSRMAAAARGVEGRGMTTA